MADSNSSLGKEDVLHEVAMKKNLDAIHNGINKMIESVIESETMNDLDLSEAADSIVECSPSVDGSTCPETKRNNCNQVRTDGYDNSMPIDGPDVTENGSKSHPDTVLSSDAKLKSSEHLGKTRPPHPSSHLLDSSKSSHSESSLSTSYLTDSLKSQICSNETGPHVTVFKGSDILVPINESSSNAVTSGNGNSDGHQHSTENSSMEAHDSHQAKESCVVAADDTIPHLQESKDNPVANVEILTLKTESTETEESSHRHIQEISSNMISEPILDDTDNDTGDKDYHSKMTAVAKTNKLVYGKPISLFKTVFLNNSKCDSHNSSDNQYQEFGDNDSSNNKNSQVDSIGKTPESCNANMDTSISICVDVDSIGKTPESCNTNAEISTSMCVDVDSIGKIPESCGTSTSVCIDESVISHPLSNRAEQVDESVSGDESVASSMNCIKNCLLENSHEEDFSGKIVNVHSVNEDPEKEMNESTIKSVENEELQCIVEDGIECIVEDRKALINCDGNLTDSSKKDIHLFCKIEESQSNDKTLMIQSYSVIDAEVQESEYSDTISEFRNLNKKCTSNQNAMTITEKSSDKEFMVVDAQAESKEMKVPDDSLELSQDTDKSTAIQNEKSDKSEPEIKSQINKEKSTTIIDNELDDEILLVDDTGKSKPVSYTTQTYSFKTILQMPSKTVLDSSSGPESETKDTKLCESVIQKKETYISASEKDLTIGVDELSLYINAATDKSSHISNNGISELKDLKVNNLPSESRKKRVLSVEEDNASISKRSKLDSTVDNCKDEAEDKPKDNAMEVVDSDEDLVFAADDKPGSSAEYSHTTENDATSKPLQLSLEALQSLITLRVRTFMATQKQTNLDKLNRRTRGMQSATNLWKETAKHLERSVLELTVLNHKLEKRKAHSNAVKNLASRTIGTQVNEDKLKSITTVSGFQLKRPEPVHSSAALTLPPSVLLNPPLSQAPQSVRQQTPVAAVNRTPPHGSVPPGSSPAQPHLPQLRPARPQLRMLPKPNIPPSSPQRPGGVPNGKLVQQQSLRPKVAANNIVNLIDLTEEEDTRKTVTQSSVSTPLQPAHTASKVVMGGKVATAPTNGYNQQTPSSGLLGQKAPILQSSVTSSIISSGTTQVGVPGSQYQLVSINNTGPSHAGAFIALVPGARMAGPTSSLPLTTGQPAMSSNEKGIPHSQTSLQTVAATTTVPKTTHSLPPSFHISTKHPAPLPSNMDSGTAPVTAKKRPPKPGLKISRVSQGIVLSWNMPSLNDVEKIASYQLFAYQELESAIPRSSLWKKVGDVKALPLPMACTLTQFQEGNKYHFAVRAVDQYGRCGAYSDPSTIFLGPKA